MLLAGAPVRNFCTHKKILGFVEPALVLNMNEIFAAGRSATNYRSISSGQIYVGNCIDLK
jgi:hypothetical protein